MTETLWAVIPAGGAGTRLWPLSRSGAPKFLHDLTGSGRTLLQATVDRLAPVVGDRTIVVTGAAHLAAVTEQLPEVDPAWLLAEPSARDSMAAIGLAAALLERHDPRAVLGSFAADHRVTDAPAFLDCVRRAVAAASDGWLVTLGISPTHPATGFGYLRPGPALAARPGTQVVEEFVEKPTAEVARSYVGEGYLWNAGMFVVRPTVLLDLLASTDRTFAATLREIAAAPERLAELWDTLPRIAIDHAVAEPAAARGRVAVVPGDFGWDDIGDFASLAGSLPPAEDGGPTVLGDPALVRAIDSTGLVVPHGDRVIAVVGLADVVVVDTGDALLVTTRSRAQDVRAIVAQLRDSAPDLT